MVCRCGFGRRLPWSIGIQGFIHSTGLILLPKPKGFIIYNALWIIILEQVKKSRSCGNEHEEVTAQPTQIHSGKLAVSAFKLTTKPL